MINARRHSHHVEPDNRLPNEGLIPRRVGLQPCCRTQRVSLEGALATAGPKNRGLDPPSGYRLAPKLQQGPCGPRAYSPAAARSASALRGGFGCGRL